MQRLSGRSSKHHHLESCSIDIDSERSRKTMHQKLPEPDEARCISILQDVIRIKSYSETQGEIEATSHMCKLMLDLGLEAECVKFAGGKRQNAIGKWKGSGGGEGSKRLLFNGHLDTNPVGEGWTVDPWGGLVKDDMIYGIGVSNMSESGLKTVISSRNLLRFGFRIWLLRLLLCCGNLTTFWMEAQIRRHAHIRGWRTTTGCRNGSSDRSGEMRL